MQLQTKFPCRKADCPGTVSQKDEYCAECKKKIDEVNDVLDDVEQEIIPGISDRTLN
jgi:hypothetical protein